VTAAATAALAQLDAPQEQEEKEGAGPDTSLADLAQPEAAAGDAAEAGAVQGDHQQQQQQQLLVSAASSTDQQALLAAALQAAAAARVVVVVREQHELKQLQRVITQGGVKHLIAPKP
jgi:hypothetical protein